MYDNRTEESVIKDELDSKGGLNHTPDSSAPPPPNAQGSSADDKQIAMYTTEKIMNVEKLKSIEQRLNKIEDRLEELNGIEEAVIKHQILVKDLSDTIITSYS